MITWGAGKKYYCPIWLGEHLTNLMDYIEYLC